LSIGIPIIIRIKIDHINARVNIKMTNPPDRLLDTADGTFVCFCGSKKIAEGALAEVALAAWRISKSDPAAVTLTFNRETGGVIDLNLSGGEMEISKRYNNSPQTIAQRGRPKLGVVAREVTLLPLHWSWLSAQPGGASVTLRRLVEMARKENTAHGNTRERINAVYKFMSAIAGDLPLFEESSRALFARKQSVFANSIASWPPDIREEMLSFAAQIDWS
jgi:uncharacterized protein